MRTPFDSSIVDDTRSHNLIFRHLPAVVIHASGRLRDQADERRPVCRFPTLLLKFVLVP